MVGSGSMGNVVGKNQISLILATILFKNMLLWTISSGQRNREGDVEGWCLICQNYISIQMFKFVENKYLLCLSFVLCGGVMN